MAVVGFVGVFNKRVFGVASSDLKRFRDPAGGRQIRCGNCEWYYNVNVVCAGGNLLERWKVQRMMWVIETQRHAN